MAIYVSPDGNDGHSGASWDQAVRSLTHAMDLAASTVPEVVHVASGLYNRASGEGFPIIVPRNVDIQGAGREHTIVEFSGVTEPDACGPADIVIDLRGTLSGVAVTNTDYDPDTMWFFPAVDIAVIDPDAVLEDASATSVWIWGATSIAHVDFIVMVTHEGFLRGGEVFPQIVDCTYATATDFLGGVLLNGGQLARLTLESKCDIWVFSPSHSIVRDNDLVDLYVVVERPSDVPAPGASDPIPQFLDNVFGTTDPTVFRGPPALTATIWINGESHWEGNEISVRRMEVAASATFRNNPLLSALQIGVRRPDAYSSLPRPRETGHAVDPQFEGNVFRQPPVSYVPGRPFGGDAVLPSVPHLVNVAADAHPVFVNNRFEMTVTDPWTPIWIEAEGNPDLGGGHGGSDGGNTFDTGPSHPHHHIEVDIGTNALTLHAQRNTWRGTPSINVLSGTVTPRTDDPSII